MTVYLALEGIDGAGKSSHAHRVVDLLRSRGVSAALYQYTRPQPGLAGVLIRSLHLLPLPKVLVPLARCDMLKAIAYGWNGRRGLAAALSAGPVDVLVADRGPVTAYAEHAHLLGSTALSWAFIDLAESRRVPEVVILLDTDPEVALERIRRRGPLAGNETLPHLLALRRKYEIVRTRPPKRLARTRWYCVDVNCTEDEAFAAIARCVDMVLAQGSC